MKQILVTYETVSGQAISLPKSEIYIVVGMFINHYNNQPRKSLELEQFWEHESTSSYHPCG
jgi:hypothetical protein